MKTNYSFLKFVKSLILLVSLTICNISNATEYTSVATGNWEDSSTWSPSGVPTTGDIVKIQNHTITVNSNASCAKIEFYGGSGGISNLTIKFGQKLTVSGDVIVIPTNNYNNDSYIEGSGELEIQNLVVGNASLVNSFPTNTRLTTLYVDELTNFIINGNMVSTTHVNTNPIAFNESRIRHRSGTITLYGVFNIQSGGPGPAALGYRTDNINQGVSCNLILRNFNPGIYVDAQTAQDFSNAIVEFNWINTINTAAADAAVNNTFLYLPGKKYKGLILNSDRRFYSDGDSEIAENGNLSLLNGRLYNNLSSNSSEQLGKIRINNNVQITRDKGIFSGNSNPILTNSNNKYSILYIGTSNKNFGVELLGQSLINGSNQVISGAIKNITLDTSGTLTLNNSYNIIVEELKFNQSSNIIGHSTNGTGSISISKLLNVPNTCNINLVDGSIILKSNSLQTARVSTLQPNTNISGKIKVERFLSNTKRQWRLLTSPLKSKNGEITGNSTVIYNWQNNGIYTTENIGVDLWGPDGTLSVTRTQVEDPDTGDIISTSTTVNNIGNGLTLINNSSYNLRKFDNTSGNWVSVTNTVSEPLFDVNKNYGFLIFATHPFLRAQNFNGGSVGSSSSTTLSASGYLITGNVTYPNILTNKFYLIGNPYASPIDFKNVLAETENSGIDKVWFIDPTVGTLGSYVTWQEGVGYSNTASIFKTNNAMGPVFQSGEAFFVRATSTTSTLTIKETHKTDGVTNATLNRNATQSNTTNYELFRILLEKEIENNYVNADGCVAAFYTGGNNEIDSADGGKLSNPGENIALVNTTSLLSIEHRNAIQNDDFLTIRISNATIGTNYKLKLYTENFNFDGYAYLQDLFLGTTTEIPLDGSVFEYEYQITENTSSTGSRFKILFQNTALSNTDVTSNDFMLYPNPVNNNESFTIQFNSKTNEIGSYECKIYNALGQLIQENNLNIVNGSASIQLNNNFNSGVYFVEINNTATNEKSTKSLIIE